MSKSKNESGAKKIVKLVAWLASPTGAGLLAPWFLPLLQINLFPDYFRPLPQVLANTAFLVAFLASLAFYRRTSQGRMRRFLGAWLGFCLVSLLVCFVVSQGFAHHWHLNAGWEPVVYFFWVLFFAMIFASFAFAIAIAGYLIVGNDA